jgi:hypothetical protein
LHLQAAQLAQQVATQWLWRLHARHKSGQANSGAGGTQGNNIRRFHPVIGTDGAYIVAGGAVTPA